MQHKNGNEKSNKDTRKWCEEHKIPWNNIEECHSKHSLVVDLKYFELEEYSDSELNIDEGNQIIDVEPSAIFSTTKFHPSELEELKEGEHLFHSQMWVKGAPIYFIIDRDSQEYLILAEVFKWFNLLMTPHFHPYTIDWLLQGRDI
jgi:hypothetical protein